MKNIMQRKELSRFAENLCTPRAALAALDKKSPADYTDSIPFFIFIMKENPSSLINVKEDVHHG